MVLLAQDAFTGANAWSLIFSVGIPAITIAVVTILNNRQERKHKDLLQQQQSRDQMMVERDKLLDLYKKEMENKEAKCKEDIDALKRRADAQDKRIVDVSYQRDRTIARVEFLEETLRQAGIKVRSFSSDRTTEDGSDLHTPLPPQG